MIEPIILKSQLGDRPVEAKLYYGIDVKEGLKNISDKSIQCVVTSPPYWGLRNYQVDGQIGLEQTPTEYTNSLVSVFREIRRVLKDDGVVWLNLGDTFHGGGGGNYGTGLSVASQHGQHLTNTRNRLDLSIEHIKPKDLIGIPWKVAFALRDDGWYLRQDIIWQKPNCMPESVTDRCTRNHEFVFMLTKEPHYYYNHEVIKEPAVTVSKQSETKINNEDLSIVDMRNKRSVWTIAPKPYKGSHFAVFPPALIEPMILAGCPIEGVVLDPFSGSGTTGLVCFQNSRNYIGIDLNPEYLELAKHRILGMKAPERNPTKEQQSSIPERNPTEEQQSSIIDLFS